MDDFNISFDEAWKMVKKTVSYTNHTVMAEALEKWAEDLIQKTIAKNLYYYSTN